MIAKPGPRCARVITTRISTRALLTLPGHGMGSHMPVRHTIHNLHTVRFLSEWLFRAIAGRRNGSGGIGWKLVPSPHTGSPQIGFGSKVYVSGICFVPPLMSK